MPLLFACGKNKFLMTWLSCFKRILLTLFISIPYLPNLVSNCLNQSTLQNEKFGLDDLFIFLRFHYASFTDEADTLAHSIKSMIIYVYLNIPRHVYNAMRIKTHFFENCKTHIISKIS